MRAATPTRPKRPARQMGWLEKAPLLEVVAAAALAEETTDAALWVTGVTEAAGVLRKVVKFRNIDENEWLTW